MKALRARITTKQSREQIIRQLEQAGIRIAESSSQKARVVGNEYSSIVGNRTKPLVIKY